MSAANVSVSQITMSTEWLLMLVMLLASSRSVESEATCVESEATCDEVVKVLLAEIEKDMDRIQDKQQQILQRLQPCAPERQTTESYGKS